MAHFTARTWVQYFFNQSEVQGNGREFSGSERPSDKAVSATPVIFGLRDAYLAKAAPGNNQVSMERRSAITSIGSTILSDKWSACALTIANRGTWTHWFNLPRALTGVRWLRWKARSCGPITARCAIKTD